VGNIRGQSVDELFTSSPTTFDEVEDGASISVPGQGPFAGQLGTRIDREVPRLDRRTSAVEAAVDEAGDRVNSARTFAIVGMFVGALGLLMAAGALVAARRRSFPGGGSKVEGGKDPAERTGSRSR
jgi:hypothetical protein